MEVIIDTSIEQSCQRAARLIANLLRRKPNAVIGFATGGTPLPLYQELIRLHVDEGLNFSKMQSFNLDEYVGLAPNHPASYHTFMQRELFDRINVNPTNVHLPDGLAQDIPAYCAQYEALIRSCGGIDIQILGIGTDGHIGFNEPSSALTSRTRIKTLTQQTRADNQPYFPKGDAVPHHAITMGIGTILEARSCILLAFGAKKAAAIAATVEGPLSGNVPASALQLHADTKVFVDNAAASMLERAEYYRYVFEHKPEWQRW